jgi:acetyl esterase/lipase
MIEGVGDSLEDGAARTRTVGQLKRWLSLRGYGLVTSALFGAATPPLKMRARFERFARMSRRALTHKRPSLVFEDHRTSDLVLESVRAVEAPARVLLHFHGGAFFMGSAASYRERAARLCHRLEAEVFVPDYRLAPEHPYPAALEDAVAALLYVRKARPGVPVFLTGDSAGGGLGLSTMLKLRDAGEPMPAGAVFLSPWTDMSTAGASVESNRGKDLWFSRAHLERWARYYVGDADVRSPYVSPVFADLAGLPPLLLLAAEDELLFDDARRVHDAATGAGVDCRLLVGRGMQHDWPLTLPWLDESKWAWQQARHFLDAIAPPH